MQQRVQRQREQWTAAPSAFLLPISMGKVVAKIAMEFFLKDPDREPATGPPVHGRPGPKSDAGGGPSFRTRAGRLGGVAYPDTPGGG